ncbi:MAG: tetratricopeptide repeat protein [Acidobacteriota bacterium]|jgi:tetratricopeptide (TPR) repeat protein
MRLHLFTSSALKSRWIIPVLLPVCLLGCVPKRPQQSILTAGQLIRRGRAEGLDLKLPFALNDRIKHVADRKIGRGGTPLDRMERISEFLNGKRGLDFTYDPTATLTACQTFNKRKGNCLAYTNLFVGIARYLKVPVYFVYLSNAGSYYAHGLFFVSSHMAIGFDMGKLSQGMQTYTAVLDLTGEMIHSPSLYRFESIDDSQATAYFYNNVAVQEMLRGRKAHAGKLLKFLLKEFPRMRALYNNLGVLELREGRPGKALKTLQAGMAYYPNYPPYYTNAVQAARESGREALARKLEAKGKRVASRSPSFLFDRGLVHYQQGDYEAAAEKFHRALRYMPNSPLLYAYLAKAYLAEGRTDAGVKAFDTSRRLFPNNPILKKIEARFPVLKTVPERRATH